MADVPLPRIGGDPDRGGELGDRELRHQRRTLTRDRHPGVAVPVPIVAASSIESAECIAAHWTAACNRSASARSAIAPSRARESDHRTCGVELSAYLAMSQLKHRPPTVQAPKTPCLTGMWTTISEKSLGRRPQRSTEATATVKAAASGRWNHRGGQPRNPKIFSPPQPRRRASTSSADVLAALPSPHRVSRRLLAQPPSTSGGRAFSRPANATISRLNRRSPCDFLQVLALHKRAPVDRFRRA